MKGVIYNVGMIVDWYLHSEKVRAEKLLSKDDPADNQISYKQEIVFIHHLIKIYGLSKSECYDEWVQIKNGIAELFRDDEEQLEIEFNKIYEHAVSNSYKIFDRVTKPLEPIIVYEDEIEYLNKLDVPVWVKEYYMGLLVYYKFQVQNINRVQLSKRLNSWIMRQTSNKSSNYGAYQDLIAQYRIKTGKNIIQYYDKKRNERYSTYVPSFMKTGGKEKFICNDISEVKEVFKFLKNTAICPICGKEYAVSSKSKVEMCPECYKKMRMEKINQNAIKYYHQKQEK